MRAPLVHLKTTIPALSERNPFYKRNCVLAAVERKWSFYTLLFAGSSPLWFALIMTLTNQIAIAALVGLSFYFLGFHFKMKRLGITLKMKTIHIPLEVGDCILHIGRFANYVWLIEKVGFQHYYLINIHSREQKMVTFRRVDKFYYYLFPTPDLSEQLRTSHKDLVEA